IVQIPASLMETSCGLRPMKKSTAIRASRPTIVRTHRVRETSTAPPADTSHGKVSVVAAGGLFHPCRPPRWALGRSFGPTPRDPAGSVLTGSPHRRGVLPSVRSTVPNHQGLVKSQVKKLTKPQVPRLCLYLVKRARGHRFQARRAAATWVS